MPCPPSRSPSPVPGTADQAPTRAGFWPRLGAVIYDSLLVLAIWILTVIILVTVSGNAVIGAWVQTLLFIELYAFLAFFWIARGQTLGMLAWRLEVRANDGRFTLGHALRRFLGVLACFASLGIGFLWIAIDRQNRSWTDIVSKSHVVRHPKPAK